MVQGIVPNGQTNFEEAITETYAILDRSVELNSNCHTAVLFLTVSLDGC